MDMRTVIFSYVISNLICMIVMAILWKQYRRRFAGVGFWLADFVMQFTALVLLALRGTIPDFLSMMGSNVLVVGGTILIYMGLERFAGKRSSQIHNYFLLVTFTLIQAYFVFIRPSLTARNILFSLALLAVCFQCAWLLMRRIALPMRLITRGVGIVFAAFCLISILRLAIDLVVPSGNEFFHSSVYDTLLVLIYQMLFIILTLSLFLMVNRGLFTDLEGEVTVRKQAEKILQRQKMELTERVKELNCIYELSHLIETPGISLDEILQGSVDLLAAAMQYPEFACAKLVLGDLSYATENYRDSAHKVSYSLKRKEQVSGTLEVCYFDEVPHTAEGIFLKEENYLLQVVTERLSRVIDRIRVEEALRLSEEKFSRAFQSSPDAIIIFRMRDGRLVEVNDGFCQLSGYSRDEALSNSAIALGLWIDPRDWERFTVDLQENHSIRDHEYEFRKKSGEILDCLYSGEMIDLGDEAHVLSVIRDISERKRAEKIVRLRLSLWEFSATHSIDELMQKALDEIEELTGSLISFYHFVEEDQNTLSLRAWSTRTLAKFCKAEGKDMHYPIADAGVWVDCVRQKRPVIHNDYASLPHRKGMPAGHAEVVREVVVPTMRDDRLVAILGVGNKLSDYDEKDIDLVNYIADVVWSIVDQKRADEQIHRLNAQLERLAMTDELTGLTNRRSFYIQGNREIQRAQRYHTSLSLLMLDLDQFKNINDRYGHSVGDKMLQCIAATLVKNIREIDVLARVGGEEFSVLLPNTKAEDAVILAERLRLAVERARYPIQGEKDLQLKITVSIGVATYRKGKSNLDAILRDADTAMYQAKNQGRNRVVFLG